MPPPRVPGREPSNRREPESEGGVAEEAAPRERGRLMIPQEKKKTSGSPETQEPCVAPEEEPASSSEDEVPTLTHGPDSEIPKAVMLAQRV